MPRPFTAIGSSVKFAFALTNAVGPSTSATLANVHTVPDPYYVTSAFEATTTSKIIKFVNLPETATIRIYTASGELFKVIDHDNPDSGQAIWNQVTDARQRVSPGIYFWTVQSDVGSAEGSLLIIK